jgi:hypothetical protein
MSFSVVKSAGSWTTGSAMFTGGNTAGDLLICLTSGDSPGISAPTDTAGNTWLDCGAGPVAYSGSYVIQLFYVPSCKGTTSDNVVSASNYAVLLLEVSGAASSNPVEAFVSNPEATTGSGSNNGTAGNLTTSDADFMVVGTLSSFNQSAGSNVAWTVAPNDSQGNSILEYFAQTAAGLIAGDYTDSNSGQTYCAVMVAFKPAGGVQNLYSISGAMANFSGSANKQVGKAPASGLALFSSSVSKQADKAVPASLALFAGSMGKQTAKLVASTFTLAGSLNKTVRAAFSAAMALMSGSRGRQTSTALQSAMSLWQGVLTWVQNIFTPATPLTASISVFPQLGGTTGTFAQLRGTTTVME